MCGMQVMPFRMDIQHVLLIVSIMWDMSPRLPLATTPWKKTRIKQSILHILPKSTLIYLDNPNCQYNLQNVRFTSINYPNLSGLVRLSLSCLVTVEADHVHYETVCAVEDYSTYTRVSLCRPFSHHTPSQQRMEEGSVWQMCFLIKVH